MVAYANASSEEMGLILRFLIFVTVRESYKITYTFLRITFLIFVINQNNMLNLIKVIIERILNICKITSNNWYDFFVDIEICTNE